MDIERRRNLLSYGLSADEAYDTSEAFYLRSRRAKEGTLNKFLIDDKGMLFLLAYGLPPLVHTDDATRAVLSCFDIAPWMIIFPEH